MEKIRLMDNKPVFSKTSLGIEFGSTRIKSILLNENYEVIASGSYHWENQFVDQKWTYSLDSIIKGLQASFKSLSEDIFKKYNTVLTEVGSIGISAMMHGYLVLDKFDNLLTPFRTWRNNYTEHVAKELSDILNYPIPARWSIAHLYYAIKYKEPHIKHIAFQTTLAGYIHYLLTGEKVIGINDASGMFKINKKTLTYDLKALNQMNEIIKSNDLDYKIEDIFPKVLIAGKTAGKLTIEGAKLLDPTGNLKSGIIFAPPEGDAATGMVATNSIKVNTGNISAGTSIFSMIVIDKELDEIHEEIDLVSTPDGNQVAMIHGNNCTSDINAWTQIFKEYSELFGYEISQDVLFEKLFLKALEGDFDAGNMISYNFVSGENITKISKGRPLFVRTSESNFTLANFIRLHLYAAFATIKIGMNILTQKEKVKVDTILGHGGIFSTKGVAQRFLAAALEVDVSVNQTANEGGPYGMALLAMYTLKQDGTLPEFLDEVFKNNMITTMKPNEAEVKGYNKFFNQYVNGLEIVKKAIEVMD